MHCPDLARIRPPQRLHGFTLLELLVAVGIFGIVGLLAIGGLRSVLDADEITREQSRRLADLQMTLATLERDLRHAQPLRPRDGFGDRQPPLRYSPVTDPEQLEFARAGLGGEERLGRVAWRVSDAGLERITWPTLDGAPPDSERRRLFLPLHRDGHADRPDGGGQPQGDPLRVRFEFLDPDSGEVVDAWPPLSAEREPGLPAMVLVRLEVPGVGEIERRIPLGSH